MEPEDPTLPQGPKADPEPVEPPVAGRRFGRYVVEDELGRGGMGIVYRAFDEDLRRHVALKLVRSHLSGNAFVTGRFEAEARITAQLQHPAIVAVYDVGRSPEGELFYTMRLVRGRTLTDAIEARQPGDGSRTRLLSAFIQVARAVAYAHERGVVHRDLKPSNVMLGPFGEVSVMDWGLAKIAGEAPAGPSRTGEEVVLLERPENTLSDTILGTPGFMAPEQAAGPATTVPASDVYALGGVLYAILAGRAPHVGSTIEVLARLARGVSPVPAREHDATVPRDLDEIALGAMAHDPRDRPTAEELAAQVEGWLEGRPARAARPEDAEFLKSYRAGEFRRPSVTVDVVVVSRPPGGPARVLLARRATPPFAGCWAVPGAFVRMDEALDACARRLLAEEAGLGAASPSEPLEVGAFGDPARDPRTRVITVAYVATVEGEPSPARCEGKALELAWFSAGALPELAFDHARIVAAALARLGRT